MANNSLNTFLTAAAAGFVGFWLFERILENQDLINPDEFGLGDRVGHHAAGGQGQASPGGKTDTPGWYTLQGHHHCGVDANGAFSPGCLCTDPKKCKGNAGTGAAYCAAHQSECWPTNEQQWCAYWYASDEKYCNLCNGWAYTGPDGSGAKACPASAVGGAAPASTSTPKATTKAAAAPKTTSAVPGGGSGTVATGQQAAARLNALDPNPTPAKSPAPKNPLGTIVPGLA